MYNLEIKPFYKSFKNIDIFLSKQWHALQTLEHDIVHFAPTLLQINFSLNTRDLFSNLSASTRNHEGSLWPVKYF